MPEPEFQNDPQPGFWMLRCCRQCPEVCARIWWCDHEPDEPENKLDRPFLQGQIGLDLAPVMRIWTRQRRPITSATYDYQIQLLHWLKGNRPTDPRLHPMRAPELRDIALPEFTR